MVTLRSLQEEAHALLRGTDVILRNRTRRLDTIPSSSSCHSRVSNPSNLALKSRLDAVKTELEFASCEAELRKAQAKLTVRQSYIQMLATQQDATAAELENIHHNNLDTNHDYDRNSVSSHGLSDTEYRGDDICDIAESLVVSPPTGHPADLSRLVDNSIHFGGHILPNVTHPQPLRDALLIPENNGHSRIDNMPVLLLSQSQSASFMFPSRLQVTSQQDSADLTVPTSIPPQVPQYGDLAQSLVVSHAGNPIPVRQLAGNTLHPPLLMPVTTCPM